MKKKVNPQQFLKYDCSMGNLLRIEYLLVDATCISFLTVFQIHTSNFRVLWNTRSVGVIPADPLAQKASQTVGST